MTSVNVAYPSFSSGEISPKLYGRYDLAAFYSGARRVENFIVDITGNAEFREGSSYAAKTFGNNKAFLWSFEFTDALSFVLEFTPLKLRFYRNNGQVREVAQAITAVTQANPAVVTYSGADNYSNGDSVFIDGVVGMTQLNGREFVVANVDTGANTFELSGLNSTGFTAYTSGGEVSVITEVVTPYTANDIFQLKFAQNATDLYIVHPSHNPKKLTYTSPVSWAIADHSPTGLTLTSNNRPSAITFFEQRLVYGGSNNNPQTLYFSKSAEPDNFTVGTAVDDGIEYTVSGDGNTIKWLRGTNKFLAIGTFGDVLQATGGIDGVITPESISIRPSNSFGVADMNPFGRGTQVFYAQRNQLILRSFEFDFESDSYIPVDRNTVADHITNSGITGIAYQEGRPNIVWCSKENGELIGMTIEDTESISGWHRHTTQGEIVSVISIPRSRAYNQLWVCVKRVVDGNTNYYIEYYNDPVTFPRREDYIDGLRAADDRLFANLMFEKQKEYIYVDSALSYNGALLGSDAGATLTAAATSGTGVTFTSSVGVFSASDVGRELWRKSVTGLETGRAIITGYTSATVVTCTVLETFNSTVTIPSGEWYLTAGEITGLDHLEGKTVTIIADGGQHPIKTVTNGTVTLDRQTSVCHVGLSYTGYLQTNDLEGGGTNGTAQTKKKSVVAVGFRFLDSLFAKFGTDYYKLEQIYERTSAMNMDRPPLPFTGDKKIPYANRTNDSYSGGWERAKRVIVVQDQPFPCTIQLVIPYMEVSNV